MTIPSPFANTAETEMNPSPASKKRTYDGELVKIDSSATPPNRAENGSSTVSRQRSRSPALSTASSSLTELTSISTQNANPADPSEPQTKKRKLTFAESEVEKAVRKREKEERAKAKEAEKSRKDEEKRTKDEEKRRKAEERDAARRMKEVEKAEKEAARKAKEAERDEKRKAKDAEKEEKDAEKAKKDAEKLKREKAQMRIGSFFGRPAPASTPPLTPDDVFSGVSSRRSSIASIDMEQPVVETKATPSSKTDYTSWILPFFPHDHTQIAPANRFMARQSPHGNNAGQSSLDLKVAASACVEKVGNRFRKSRRRIRTVVPVKSIVTKLHGSKNTPIDLTRDASNREITYLSRAVYKIISFSQDVRPPYKGTYTRPVSPRSSRRLARKPTYRGLPDTNYDYDSEAEWQEPDPDDEDLGEEDEMSEDDDDAQEIDDFLDDEEDTSKRKITAMDVDPVCSGLCWEGETSLRVGGIDLASYRMDVLHDSTSLPIDPYCNNHWTQTTRSTPVKTEKQAMGATLAPAMQPPRLPLASVSAPNVSPLRKFVTGTKIEDEQSQSENKVQQSKPRGRAPNPNKSIKTIPEGVLPAFRAAVDGSDLNKVALTEILKKKFPKCSKDAIKDTLSTIAVRQGVKEADKRWVLIA